MSIHLLYLESNRTKLTIFGNFFTFISGIYFCIDQYISISNQARQFLFRIRAEIQNWTERINVWNCIMICLWLVLLFCYNAWHLFWIVFGANSWLSFMYIHRQIIICILYRWRALIVNLSRVFVKWINLIDGWFFKRKWK